MSITFIGDVHGWIDRLERLLDKSEGHLLFVGDLLDRGPDAPAVIARVRALCESGKAQCLMGNHEYAVVRGLGVKEMGIAEDAPLFEAWAERYGGRAVLDAYGIAGNNAARLRASLGDHLSWIAGLPWVLEGEENDERWIAVHAGLNRQQYKPQLRDLRDGPASMQTANLPLPPALYAKPRAFMIPEDLPKNSCIVSGHTPMEEVYLQEQRILCDTSGGLPDRLLSGVIWPQRKVITG